MGREENRSGKRRRRFRLWHVPIAIVLVCLGAACVSRWHGNRALRQRLAAFGEQGYPVTLAELQALYPPLEPGWDNAADLILEAAQTYVDRLSREEVELLPFHGRFPMSWRGWALSPKVRDVTEKFLADNQEQIALLHRAAGMEECRYPVDFAPGSSTPFRSREIYTSGNLLCLSALLAFDEGRTQAGVESLWAALRIAESARRIPSVHGALMDRSIHRQTLTVLEWGLAREEFTDAQLRSLQETLDIDDAPDRWAHVFAAHLHRVLFYFEKPELWRRPPGPFAPLLKFYGALGLAAKEAVLFVDMIESYIDVTRRPLSEWQNATAALDVELNETLRGCVLLSPTNRGAFSGLLMGHIKSRARSEAARAALAVERYRLAAGSLPESIADLVPRFLEAVPQDPYTGRPMLYEKTGTGFVVYSVGVDGRDDGGWETADEVHDVAFTIKRKEAADDAQGG